MKDRVIFVAGANGMVGRSLVETLTSSGYSHLLTPSSSELNLTNYNSVFEYFVRNKPDIVIIAAAKVGGIMANINEPVDFIENNLFIQTNLIKVSSLTNVKKLIFIASSCIYPRLSKQPMKEDYILSGPLEPTNQYYSIAKLAGIKHIEAYKKQFNKNFLSLIPCNLYGKNDNFDPISSHVIAGLIRKFHLAKMEDLKEVVLWGTGHARREFLFVDDFAKSVVYFIENNISEAFINIGSGVDYSIKELAGIIASIIGYNGSIRFDKVNPDGMPKKLLDISRQVNYGWNSTTTIKQGISLTYEWYLAHQDELRKSI
jgi:GDP-L-fucose synthase